MAAPTEEEKEKLITSFTDATQCSSREEARQCLERHNWEIYKAVLAFTKNKTVESNPARSHPANIRGADNDSDKNKGGGDQSGTMGDVERPPSHREIVSAEPGQPYVMITHLVYLYRNGFTVNSGPLMTLDDPVNAAFLQFIQSLDFPRRLNPGDSSKLIISVNLINRQQQDHFEPFQGVGRFLGPKTTLIQIELIDGTRIASRFNTHQTIGDIHDFIDESRPGGPTDYELVMAEPPHTPVPRTTETIEETGIANSVLMQKLIEF